MLPGSDSLDDIAADALDDVCLPPATATGQRVNKFQPKPRGKPKKPAAVAVSKINSAKENAEVSAVVELGDAVVGVVEATGPSNHSASSCAPMDFSSQVNETQEPLDLNKTSLTHEVASLDSQASERERNLQIVPYQPEEEAMPLLSGMESHDGIFSQPNDAVKQAGKFQPKSGLRVKKQKAKSVSFVLPDAAETAAESVSQLKEKKAKSVSFSLSDGADTAASPVREHSEVLADSLAGPEPSFIHIMNDEVVDRIPHSASVTSDNVDVQLDHENARSEDLPYLSSVESFDIILSKPASVTGKTVPKFRPKPSAKVKTAKANGSGKANDAEESTAQWDSLPMDTEPLEDCDLCTTNLSSEQVDPVQISSLEAGSPQGDEVFESIDTTLDSDNYTDGERNLSAVSQEVGNELHSWNDDEQTQQTLDDQSTSKAFEEHGASKSLWKLRKRNSPGSSSGKLDRGISENWDVESYDNSQMDDDHNDDESKREEMPKQRKNPKRSERETTDAQKPSKRRSKSSKELDSTKAEPPKKKFPHGTRRKRRQVDKDLLEKPEYELDRRQIVIRQLILLGEAKERAASKEGAALGNNQSNSGFFSNASHFDEDNPYDDDNDPSGEKAHLERLRNTKKVNYQTHMNREKSGRWSKAETELFYEAIRQFGTDFGMIEKLFPNRTRRQVKSKFKTEERIHPSVLRDAMSHRSTDHSHFEKVIELLQTQAEEESRQDDANGDPTTVSQDAANGNKEERDQPEKTEQDANRFDGEADGFEKIDEQDANGFDGEADGFEKIDEWDGDGTSEYNEYEAIEWDASASSPQNEEKYSEYDEFY